MHIQTCCADVLTPRCEKPHIMLARVAGRQGSSAARWMGFAVAGTWIRARRFAARTDIDARETSREGRVR